MSLVRQNITVPRNMGNSMALPTIPRSANYSNNKVMLNNYMTSFYNKNPDLKNNPDLLLAQISAAAIPALSTLLALAAKRGETFVRGLFLSKNDKALLRAAGVNSTNRGIVNNLRRLGLNTRASNNRSLVAFRNANRALNNYRGNNVNTIRNKARALDAQKVRVYAGIMKTVLILLLALKLAFGLLFEEAAKLANISTFNERTIQNDINTLARVMFVLMNAVVPAIYALVQRPAVQVLGGKNVANMAAGLVSVAAYRFAFDEAAVKLMMGTLQSLTRQANSLIVNNKVKAVFKLGKIMLPGARNIAVDAGTSMLRLTRKSLLDLTKWVAGAMATGVAATAAGAVMEARKPAIRPSPNNRARNNLVRRLNNR